MKDFFLHINTSGDNNLTIKANRFFEELFPEAINRVIDFDGVSISCSFATQVEHTNILYSPSKKAHIFISGDYNFSGLSSNITNTNSGQKEVLLTLFERFGESLFSRMAGNFNAVIYYPDNQILKVINSKLGLYPLYYHHTGDELVLSTRLGFFKRLNKTSKPNFPVIMQYCLYNYPVSSATILENVSLLPAASILTFYQGKISISRYWSMMDEFGKESASKSFKRSVDLIDDVLNRSIGNVCKVHDRVGISLTGGWDGRLILAYAQKYLNADQIFLYSHGTEENPDVSLPMATAQKLGYHYLPVLLTDSKYVMHQLHWASETVKYSDGMRQISRLHYLYNMSLLKNENGIDFIVSGIGGSNLLKSTNYKPCDVFNKYVIELIESDNIEQTLKNHYNLINSSYSSLFSSIGLENFVNAFDLKSFDELSLIENKTQRFIYFLISEIERRYFGSELQSYKHLVTNYSPFFDDEFILALPQTVFFEPSLNRGLLKSHYISVLYAKLTAKNNKILSKEPTDRGFSMYEVANPFMFPVMLYKYFREKLKHPANPDYFNHKDFMKEYVRSNLPTNLQQLESDRLNSLFIENYITASSFLDN